MKLSFKILFLTVICCVVATAQTPTPTTTQTPSDAQHFNKAGLVFDYPNGWTLADISDDDAQQYTLSRNNSDLQMRVFAHKGRVTQEKMDEAKKSFIEPYVKAISNQFRQMGATPSETADSTEIAGLPADGVKIAASLGGDPGAAKIYWVLLGQRVVVLTLFGPDREIKQFTPAWDLFRKSLKIEDPKAAASPSPKP